MAQPNTFNPYGMIGAEIGPGLNAIIAAMPNPATATAEVLVDEVYNFISSTYYPPPTSPQLETEIKSVAYHAINSLMNSLVLSGNAAYNMNQMPFIAMLLGGRNSDISAFRDRVADIEDNIGTSLLTVGEQIPLFLGTTIGKNAYNYWTAEIAAGVASPWAPYFSANAAENYINTVNWCTAAMNGALAGYGATRQGLISPTTDIVSVDMISALIGALTLTAGKLMFNWIPKIVKPLTLNRRMIGGLNPNPPNPNTDPTVVEPPQYFWTITGLLWNDFGNSPIIFFGGGGGSKDTLHIKEAVVWPNFINTV